MFTFNTRVVSGIAITSYYSSFHGNSIDWQNSYFELLSWHNTYYLDYELCICGRGDNPCVRVVVPDDCSIPDRLVEYMQDLHYGDISKYSVKICLVEPSSDFDDPDIDEWFLE